MNDNDRDANKQTAADAKTRQSQEARTLVDRRREPRAALPEEERRHHERRMAAMWANVIEPPKNR